MKKLFLFLILLSTNIYCAEIMEQIHEAHTDIDRSREEFINDFDPESLKHLTNAVEKLTNIIEMQQIKLAQGEAKLIVLMEKITKLESEALPEL